MFLFPLCCGNQDNLIFVYVSVINNYNKTDKGNIPLKAQEKGTNVYNAEVIAKDKFCLHQHASNITLM